MLLAPLASLGSSVSAVLMSPRVRGFGLLANALGVIVCLADPHAASAQLETANYSVSVRTDATWITPTGNFSDTDGDTFNPSWPNSVVRNYTALTAVSSAQADLTASFLNNDRLSARGSAAATSNCSQGFESCSGDALSQFEIVFDAPTRLTYTFASGLLNPGEGGVSSIELSRTNGDSIFTRTSVGSFAGQSGVLEPGTYRLRATASALEETSTGFSPRGRFEFEFVLSLAPPPGDCPGDADSSGGVNFADITAVLGNFGTSGAPGTFAGDADGNGTVNFGDITSVLGNFGTSCL
jgi:hypothetical protein